METQIQPFSWEKLADEEAIPRPRLQPRNNIVLPAPPARRMELLPPEATSWDINLGQSQPAIQLKTTYRDRAAGFLLESLPLSVAAGIFAVVLALVGLGRPFGPGLLLWFGLAFLTVWTIAFIAHKIIAPDGALFLSVFGSYRLLRAEQKERHRRMRRMEDGE